MKFETRIINSDKPRGKAATKRTEAIAIVVASLILGLIKTMDLQQQIKGSTINYVSLMRKKIHKSKATKDEREKMAHTARDSMMMLVEQFSDGNCAVMQVATFVEALSFSFEDELTEFYGQDYMPRMLRFTDKQVVDSGLAKDSYTLSDQLKDNIRKITFDRRVA